MFSFMMNPNIIPDAPPGDEQFEEKSVDCGKIEVSSGTLEVKICPVTFGTRVPGLGPNGADMSELKTIVDDMTVPDFKRTIRSILQ